MRKKRVFIPKLVFVPLFGIAFFSQHLWREEGLLNLSFEIAAITLVTISAIGRIWTSAFVAGKKNQQLVVIGPYAIVRNPLYLFSLLGFIGAGLAFETFTFAILFALTFLVTHLPTILAEEKFLREKFGEQFEEYSQSVPRLIPRSWRPNCPVEWSFNPRVYSRSVLDSSLIVSMILVAQVVEWGHLNHVFPVYFHLP